MSEDSQRGLFEALVKDGRPLLSVTALALLFSGCFALYVSAVGQFLPHDLEYLGSSAESLLSIADGRLSNFMFHDRVAFGGALLAVAVLYLWLLEFPLAAGERWSWWALSISGALGFASFLSYLGYGYLDTWHGVGTVALLPIFGLGLARSRAVAKIPIPKRSLSSWGQNAVLGRGLLLFTGAGMALAGLTILFVGMTSVFVPQDLAYMDVSAEELARQNPRLVPLIAHDRAGFGGGLATCGVLVLYCVWFGQLKRALLQALAISGICGFGAAIGVHFAIGYTDFIHLAPAYVGLTMYLVGLALSIGALRTQSAGPSQ